MRITLAMLAVLSISTVASADIWLEVDAAPVAGLPNFTAYTVSAHMDNGDCFNSIRGTFTGPMYQVWDYGVIPTPNFVTGFPDNPQDSRFMFGLAGILAVQAPWEEAGAPPTGGLGSFLGGALYDDFGVLIPGSEYMEAAFALKTPSYSTINVARIVIPDGEAVVFDGEIGGMDATGTAAVSAYYRPPDVDNEPYGNFPGAEDVDWNGNDALDLEDNRITIPEPATMLILAGGAVALIRRRR